MLPLLLLWRRGGFLSVDFSSEEVSLRRKSKETKQEKKYFSVRQDCRNTSHNNIIPAVLVDNQMRLESVRTFKSCVMLLWANMKLKLHVLHDPMRLCGFNYDIFWLFRRLILSLVDVIMHHRGAGGWWRYESAPGRSLPAPNITNIKGCHGVWGCVSMSFFSNSPFVGIYGVLMCYFLYFGF